MFKFSKRSLDNLAGVATPLQLIVSRALLYSEVDFGVIEGIRTVERQQEMVAKGSSKTMNSYHLTGKAVDLMAYKNGKGSWDLALYVKINEAMQRAASELGFTITWGGSWKTLVDGPHFQLED